MTDAPHIDGGRADRLRAGLKRRYARETRFRMYGLLAIAVAVGFLLLLLGRIVEQGHTAFYAHTVTTVTVQIVTLLTGDQEFDSPKTLAAFGLGLTLFLITLVLNIIAQRIVHTYRQQYD